MNNLSGNEVSVQRWTQLLAVMEDKLQMGILTQARAVTEVDWSSEELLLTVSSKEAFDFFSAEVNIQRLKIFARQISPVNDIKTALLEAEKTAIP